MKKILIIIVLLIICIAGVIAIVFWPREGEKKVVETPSQQIPINKNDERKDSMNKIFIRGKEYEISYENNETVQELRKTFPLTVTMKDLNDNEKYVYLDNSLPTSAEKVGRVEAGDVMLFGDNCLVIFYESFDTGYSYTKIGHIDELKLETGNSVEVEFR